jgi:hypothetical protein
MTSRGPKSAFTRGRATEDIDPRGRPEPSKERPRKLIISGRSSRSMSRPTFAAASKSQPSGAELPSPRCCAICRPASFLPIPGTARENSPPSSSFGSRNRSRTEIRFGRSVDQHIIDRQWRIVSFEAGSIFALVRWAGNEYRTTLSRINILRAIAPGDRHHHTVYAPRRRKSAAGFRLAQGREGAAGHRCDRGARHRSGRCRPHYWQHVHNRVSVGERPRPDTKTRHQAWLRRRNLI